MGLSRHKHFRFLGALLLLVCLTLVLAAATHTHAATFTVINTSDSGADSLRQAILDANANAGLDAIDFNVGGGGAQTIALSSDLPNITDDVTIDGSSQPGFTAAPLIRLEGFSTGLVLSSVAEATITDLDLSKGSPCTFSGSGIGIQVSNSSNVMIDNVNASGRGNGIIITGGSNVEVLNSDLSDSGCANVGSALSVNNVTNFRGSGNMWTDSRAVRLTNLTGFTVTDAVPGASTHYLAMELTSDSNTGSLGLILSDVNNSVVENVDFSDPNACTFGNSQAVSVSSSSDLTIRDVNLSSRGYGIGVSGGDNVDVLNNDLTDSGCSNVGFALQVNNVTNFRGSGNMWTDSRAVRLTNLTGFTVTDAVPGASTHYLAMEPTNGSNTGSLGLILSDVNNSVVENVDFSDPNACTFGNSQAVSVFNSSDLTIRDVSVSSRGYGIGVSGGDNVDVLDNDLTDSGCSNVGFALQANNVTDFRASGNNFANASTGVRLDGLMGFTVTDAVPGALTHYLVLQPTGGINTTPGSALILNNVSGSLVENVDLSFSAGAQGTGLVANSSMVTIQNVTATNRLTGINVTGSSDVQVLDAINGDIAVGTGAKLGIGTSPGQATITGNLTLNAGSIFSVDINGDTPGTQHDQVIVNGTVTINNATLTGTTGTLPTGPITIINNDAAEAIAGSGFAVAPNDGNVVNIGGQDYGVFYTGDDGNDLVLAAVFNLGMQLNDGWNLISIPLIFADPNIPTVFADLITAGELKVVRGFDASGAKTFVPNPPAGVVNDLTDISSERGYWVRVNQETTLNVVGVPAPRDIQIDLNAPWNLISYLPEPPPPYDPQSDFDDLGPPGILDPLIAAPTDATPGAGLEVVRGYGPDPTDAAPGGKTWVNGLTNFNDLARLSVFRGYWMRVQAGGTFQYDDDGSGADSVFTPAPPVPPLLAQRDFIPTPTNVDFHGGVLLDELPAPVGAVITAYDPQGVLCGQFTVKQAGTFGFHHVYGDDVTTPDRDEGAERGDRITFHVNGRVATADTLPIWRADGAILKVNLSASTKIIPEVTRAYQNFPNPFNPETWIPYELSQEAAVTITIYDVAGRVVRRLSLGRQEAGQYLEKEEAAYWDGRSESGELVSSSIYFYHLRAGDYHATRKMIILK